ncbi:MAG TPA: hypothetical protein VMV83_07190 [Rectinemataceae bacterium]|nr:hypothetical protein [Rectinemataceae bacterium]
MSGCGLETVDYITAPSFYPGGGFLVLTDMAGAGTTPRDFEILYRIYESQSDAARAWNNLNSLISSGATPSSVYYQVKSGTYGLRPVLFTYTDTSANPDPSILRLSPSEQGKNASFQIGTPNSDDWTVDKGSSTRIATAVSRNTIGTSNKPIYDISQILNPSNDVDYSPDSTITDPSTQYPPPSSKAYIVLCAVAETTPDFINYTYSMPTPLSYGILQLPDGTQPLPSQ